MSQRRDDLGHFLRGLIHDHPAIDGVDEPARQDDRAELCLQSQSNQPNGNHRGLARAGRQVATRRNIAIRKPATQLRLPGKGIIARQSLE